MLDEIFFKSHGTFIYLWSSVFASFRAPMFGPTRWQELTLCTLAKHRIERSMRPSYAEIDDSSLSIGSLPVD
jgi:hypothetical protein